MRYNTIFNVPNERTKITYPWVWWDDWFTTEEIDKIVQCCSIEKREEAGTIGGLNIDIRISKIKFYELNTDTQWIFEKLNNAITLFNNRWYGFELNGYPSFQYTEYFAEEQGKYDWHMDMCMGNDCPMDMIEPRKLSLLMLLSEPGVDFEGGLFQVNTGQEQYAKTVDFKKGRIIAFPSWMLHRVTPVTEGIRRSLVVW